MRQDVLAGRLLCEGRNHDHEWLVCRDSETLAMFLAARGYALVRTPGAPACGAPAVGGPCVLARGHNMGRVDIPEYHAAATPSPTPPEGLRAALERLLAAAVEMDDGITEHGWAIRDARAILAASPAPDPGAGLRTALAEIDQWLDELDSVSVDWAPAHSAPYVSKFVLRPGIQAILARHGFTAAPSAEPPETA